MRTRQLHTWILLTLDLLAGLVLFNLLAWLRGIAGPEHWILFPLLWPLCLIVGALYLIDGYRSRTEMMSADYTSQHLLAFIMALLVTLLLTYVAIPSGFPLQGSRFVIALAFLLLGLVTLTYRRSIHRWAAVGQQRSCILFIGDQTACAQFKELCATHRLKEEILCAVVGNDAASAAATADPSLRDYQNVMNDVREGRLRVEAIVLRESAHHLPTALADELTELYFKGVPTYTLELFYETYWRKIPLYRINFVWLFQEGFEIARNPVFERTKRIADVCLSSLGLLFASLPLLVSALLIKFEDGGPVFFRQTRIGRNRVPFQMFKLRTMRAKPIEAPPSPTSASDARYTQENDPRITRIGAFLRQSRLDEVPQLWNVLRGEMSMIGPRAEWDELVKDYETNIPCYHFRHLVKPGVTGWAQINYPYGANQEDTLRKLEYDLYYIRHFSFVMDAAIILRTVHVMLFGKGR